MLTHLQFKSTTAKAILWIFALPLVALADHEDPVESGRDALRRTGNMPWYDADADELRQVEAEAPADPPSRSGADSAKQTSPKDTNPQNRGVGGLGTGASMFLTMVYYTGLALIAAIVIAVLVLAIRTLADRGGGGGWQPSDEVRHIVDDVDRMEQLPVPLKRNLSDLLGEAKRQYEAGNYNEAVIYLYSYLLVELDKAQRIRLLRGKTNRQYLRELTDAPPTLSGLVERTMVAFEDVFFGDRDLERARFESCYGELDEFHQYVEPAVT